MQICYSDVVHRAKQKETERVLQRCVKIVQKFIHLYSQNLRDNGRKLRRLIFSIPSFCFSTIPSKRIIKTILRHVVEKQTVDSDITEILETLSAFATVLERWTVNDKICVQCVAQIIQYISVVFSQNSTLATPHRAVFFQVVYICLRLVRVVDSTMKSFTSRSSRQNERIGGNLLPSLYDLLQNLPKFESRETRLYVKFLQLYYHLCVCLRVFCISGESRGWPLPLTGRGKKERGLSMSWPCCRGTFSSWLLSTDVLATKFESPVCVL